MLASPIPGLTQRDRCEMAIGRSRDTSDSDRLSTTQTNRTLPAGGGNARAAFPGGREENHRVKNLTCSLVCVLAILGGVSASAQAQEIVLQPGKSATAAGAF